MLRRIGAVGDIAEGPGDTERCYRLLTNAGVEAVRGNHDRWALNDALRDLPGASTALDDSRSQFLDSLPATRAYETTAGQLLLCHGLGTDDMNRLTPDDFGYALEANDALQQIIRADVYRFVVNGHTHHRMVRVVGHLTIINVGTLLRDHDPCFAVIDFDDRSVSFFDIPTQGEITPAQRHSL